VYEIFFVSILRCDLPITAHTVYNEFYLIQDGVILFQLELVTGHWTSPHRPVRCSHMLNIRMV